MSLLQWPLVLCSAVALALGLVPATHAARPSSRASGVPRTAPVAPASFFGINSGSEVLELPPAERDRHLGLMAAAGLTVVRRDASWSSTEREAPDPETGARRYDWTASDATADALAGAGLTWYPMLAYSTEWSGREPGNVMSAPAPQHVGDFAAYAQAFAARYGRGGAFWDQHPELPARPVAAYEIWNEPNTRMFWPDQADAPEDYAALFAAARSAIAAVDPVTPVVTGGLLDTNAMDPSTFLRRVVRARPELRTVIGGVGYHPYQSSYAGIMGGVRRLRTTLDGLGLRRTPIAITELGANTAWLPEPRRAELFRRLARDLPAADLGVSHLMPYVWSHGGGGFGAGWGLVGLDGTPTSTASAYLAGARRAAAARARAAAHPSPAATPVRRITVRPLDRG